VENLSYSIGEGRREGPEGGGGGGGPGGLPSSLLPPPRNLKPEKNINNRKGSGEKIELKF
jgi:hypothetical protein